MVKRTGINLDLNGNALYDYPFIDHVRGGDQFGGPGSSAWSTGITWADYIDASGWPTFSSTSKSYNIVGITIPSSSDFAGPYIVDGMGSGRIRIGLTSASWTFANISGATSVSSDTWDVVDSGSGWSFQLTFSGNRQGPFITIQRNDPLGSGAYLRNIRFYRAEDAEDLTEGKIFRSAWKQAYADFNPSFIRAMNWTGGNNARGIRFEHRTLPSYAQWSASIYSGGFNWVASPKYGETTGTNQYALSSVTGTPASMQHGEIASCRIGSSMVRCGASFGNTVSAITKANPGVVTATAHGFNTGDKIVHIINSGMVELNYVPCTITVSDANTYSIGIDTTSFTTFTSGNARQYITLQVGSGGDRTKATGAIYNGYPIVRANGNSPASTLGNTHIVAGDYKTFYFDKKHAAQRDLSGNWIYGAWIFTDNGTQNGHNGGVPLEVTVAAVNEIMQMTRSDGRPVDPIDLWVCVPHMALLSPDPDYSAASNYAIGMVDVCLNGANGYAGLDSRCKLRVEYSNETWNNGDSSIQTNYLARLGFLRWGGGTQDFVSMSSLRSMIMVQDILAASQNFPRGRLIFVLAGQGTTAFQTSNQNQLRVDGTANVLTDALNPGGVTPISLFDQFAFAAYIEPSVAFDAANVATLVASWLSHAGNPVAQEADCAAYVVGLENAGVTAPGNETVYRYRESILTDLAAAMAARGKITCMYEAGWNHATASGQPGWVLYAPSATDQANFFQAVKKSRAWAECLLSLSEAFDQSTNAANIGNPCDYILLNSRWGHLSPDPYANSTGGVEWSGTDLAWDLMSLRNRGKRQFLIKT